MKDIKDLQAFIQALVKEEVKKLYEKQVAHLGDNLEMQIEEQILKREDAEDRSIVRDWESFIKERARYWDLWACKYFSSHKEVVSSVTSFMKRNLAAQRESYNDLLRAIDELENRLERAYSLWDQRPFIEVEEDD